MRERQQLGTTTAEIRDNGTLWDKNRTDRDAAFTILSDINTKERCINRRARDRNGTFKDINGSPMDINRYPEI